MFLGLMPFLALALGIGPLSRWKRNEPSELIRKLWWAGALSLAVGIATLFVTDIADAWKVGLGLGLALWILLSHGINITERYKHRGFAAALSDLGGKGRSYYGMWLAHVGVAITVVGITMVANYDIEQDVRMSPGDRYEMEGYVFQFDGVTRLRGPNYVADRGKFHVYQGDKLITVLEPEKRTYTVQTMPMTEAAVDTGLFRDLYVAMGDPVPGTDGWAMRVYYKPFVLWIWLGPLVMAIGGLLALLDPRYRKLAKRASTALQEENLVAESVTARPAPAMSRSTS